MAENRKVDIKVDDSFTGPVCDLGVGFLKVSEDNRDASPIGTGTFARLGKTSGIITAGHVLDALPEGNVGLVRFPSVEPALQNFRLDLDHTDRIVDWNGQDGDAPDIGFLKIPELDARSLEAKGAVFYNLALVRSFVPSRPGHQMAKAYAVVGVVGEWTEEGPAMQAKGKKKIIGGLFGAAKTVRQLTENETELVEVTIDYTTGPKVPKSYGGVSGGALWELHVELDGQSKVVKVNKKLYGIAFRQSLDHTVIFCNTAPAIESITAKIEATWPTEPNV
jgi:hypothetical protein